MCLRLRLLLDTLLAIFRPCHSINIKLFHWASWNRTLQQLSPHTDRGRPKTGRNNNIPRPRKKELMILMIPKHFLLCSSRFIHTRTLEKIAFRLERPFFNDDGSETESKKKERNKDSLEFTDTTECLQRAQFRLPEQASRSFSFHFPARFQRSPRLRSNFKLIEKNYSGAVQFVSCACPRRLLLKCVSLSFSSFCSFISFALCAVPTRKQNLFFLSLLATTKTQAKIWDPLLCRAWLHIGSLKKV